MEFSLRTDFQPVVSAAHMRSVGGEALLRAANASGQSVPPLDVFAKALARNQSKALHDLVLEAHLTHCLPIIGPNRWLFLNCPPEALNLDRDGRSLLQRAVERHGWSPKRIVIEVLEQAAFSNEEITDAMQSHQAKGFSVAIDDFGTGASNFDRVWGVRPDFVKLDRSLVQRASMSRSDRRVAKLLVSMIHRMGAMVVAEGVETVEEALAMMDADVDFLQGFYFARPTIDCEEGIERAEAVVRDLWPALAKLNHEVGSQERAHMSAVRNMLVAAVRTYRSTQSLASAAKQIFVAPSAISCVLLDDQGIQVGEAIRRDPMDAGEKLLPLSPGTGANWSRRPYFKDALRRPGRAVVHGPHFSLIDGAFIYTMAVTMEVGEKQMILCANFRLESEELSVTVFDFAA
jgi:EAL domain-containing protein (putative c-di-GMP-specific phosphodiesterase class I)